MTEESSTVTVDEPRDAVTREWELFVREAATEPLVHVGSVSAPSASIAREQARSLFGWTVEALWCCPADEVERVQTTAVSAVASAEGDEA